MTNGWYERVGSDKQVTQGDIILDCLVLRWRPERMPVSDGAESETLRALTEALAEDVVVMTQACDLEHDKVADVVLCPHYALADYRTFWTREMQRAEQKPTDKAWLHQCDAICSGFVWNLAMLNAGGTGDLHISQRIVDFHEVYTVPRAFLESLLQSRGKDRLRLTPPYREHLSQAFARFFMRVGLPTEVERVW